MKKQQINRRDLAKITLAGTVAASLSSYSLPQVVGEEVGNPELKIAGYDYDRVKAIQSGKLELDGYKISFHQEDIYGVNKHAFGPSQKYEVSEIGLIPFITRYANEGFRDYSLLPIFISRIFRHRNIFVRTDSGIEKPEDLKGKRIGTPGYGMSANTWIRGFLQDQHGVRPEDMHWVEATKSSDGGKLNSGFNKYYFPDNFPLEKGPVGVDESELLISGKVDALITAITPKAFLHKHPKIKRLFPNFRSAEQSYFKQTNVFPIMHAVAIRNNFADANPMLPEAVFKLYSQAKQAAYDDLETTTSLKVTLPWVTQEFQDTQKLMGDNFWKYGIEANRKELELVMRYTYEQGLTKRKVRIEEVFHPSTLTISEG